MPLGHVKFPASLPLLPILIKRRCFCRYWLLCKFPNGVGTTAVPAAGEVGVACTFFESSSEDSPSLAKPRRCEERDLDIDRPPTELVEPVRELPSELPGVLLALLRLLPIPEVELLPEGVEAPLSLLPYLFFRYRAQLES